MKLELKLVVLVDSVLTITAATVSQVLINCVATPASLLLLQRCHPHVFD